MIYKTVLCNGLRFGLYESLFQGLENSQGLFTASLGAATATAVVTTAVTYPLDLAQGRMAADMTKKSTGVVTGAAKPRLYGSVRDCLKQTHQSTSARFGNLYCGLPSALAAQVPYTVVLLGSFEAFSSLTDSANTHFTKRDGRSFFEKYLTRFGAGIASLILAQTLVYPLDTVKRRMQLNGATGHKNIYRSDLQCFQHILKEEGLR